MRECSRNRPTTDLTLMLSLMPSTPGRTEHMPRTMRSISTPAALALYSAAITLRIDDRVALHHDSAVAVAALPLTLAVDEIDDPRAQRVRRDEQLAVLPLA